MTAFIAIEGGDGVGKNTISTLLTERLTALGFSVQKIDFPQYTKTLAGRALGDFLSGRFVGVAVKTAAALYALDRFESAQMQGWRNGRKDYVIFDRYIASNVAYQSAKVRQEQRPELQEWILNLECNVYGLPKPDISILLRLPHGNAKELIDKKNARSYTEEKFDIHEANLDLQTKLRHIYDDMVERRVLGPWTTIDVLHGGSLRMPNDIAQEALEAILARR
ncbi:MAG: hypothetical protein ACU0DH_13365 [Paracoccus sp. (in: a-proteobacteria)]|uniref:hypothetical protein n=1 Tax=Paracoccus sp. TaxID=267 RepID=UPI004059A037